MNADECLPNDHLRHARSLKGWSQAELAEQVGTSFEMVSRWERGVTIPSPYYRERLCAVLDQKAEDLGLTSQRTIIATSSSSQLVLLACSHLDSQKAIVPHLKNALQDRGLTLWSSRQIGRGGIEQARTTLREVTRTAQAVLVILSPHARSSRYVREALEMARRYQCRIYGLWIEGEDWQENLPNGWRELSVLIDGRGRDDIHFFEEVAGALQQEEGSPHEHAAPLSNKPEAPVPTIKTDNADLALQSMMPSLPSSESSTVIPTSPRSFTYPLKRANIVGEKSFAALLKWLLIGLTLVVIIGGILGNTGLLARIALLGAHSNTTILTVARGGTWTDDLVKEPDSLIPNGALGVYSAMLDQALYLPLFYGDAQGITHPGAAREIPTLQNGGISADFKGWTFHLRPHLTWSDGQPYDARDVDYTWKLWLNPKFGAGFTQGLNLITSTDVSADHLTITFHLHRPFAPFLGDLWEDGVNAPMPEHYFSKMAPETILKSPDNLNPKVVSGPFMMAESLPGDHYTLVRNPRYYHANDGLPYLDKVVFRIASNYDTILKDLRAGTIDSSWFLDVSQVQVYQHLNNYMLTRAPTSANYEALYFNFHNTVLASHREVRQAIAMAIDHQALIQVARHGFAMPLCTDHGSAMHPGYEPGANCPVFAPAVANKLLDDYGWVKGTDGIRAREGQRLEFEYSTTANVPWRIDGETILQQNLQTIGIKLDVQNYPSRMFFDSFLPEGKASPSMGAMTSRYDIAEFEDGMGYDPDDSWLLACDQIPPKGTKNNIAFYCNPALDSLYKQELATADPGLRQQIFHQIHDLYLTEFPFIVLYSPPDIAMVRKGTHNYLPGPIGAEETINIWEWWCDNGKC